MSNLPEKWENKSAILFYQTEDGQSRIEVRLEDNTVWLRQAQLAELFQTSVPNVSMHIRNVLEEGELQADSVVKDFLTTAADGKNYRVAFYNPDVIISAIAPDKERVAEGQQGGNDVAAFRTAQASE